MELFWVNNVGDDLLVGYRSFSLVGRPNAQTSHRKRIERLVERPWQAKERHSDPLEILKFNECLHVTHDSWENQGIPYER